MCMLQSNGLKPFFMCYIFCCFQMKTIQTLNVSQFIESMSSLAYNLQFKIPKSTHTVVVGGYIQHNLHVHFKMILI